MHQADSRSVDENGDPALREITSRECNRPPLSSPFSLTEMDRKRRENGGESLIKAYPFKNKCLQGNKCCHV